MRHDERRLRLGPDERRKHLALMVGAVAALSLLAVAMIYLLRWYGGGTKSDEITLRKIPLYQAPMLVQEAAAKLARSRVGYVMQVGEVQYLVISSGEMGERLELKGAQKMQGKPVVGVQLSTGAAGERLLVAEIRPGVADPRLLRFDLDGRVGAIAALINLHGLPLVSLPDKEQIALVGPQPNVRVMGSMVQVSGFARVPDGRLQMQVLSAGKGQVLGEGKDVLTAAPGPDWGSFRVNIPLHLLSQEGEAVLMVYHLDSEAKIAVPIRYGMN